MKRMLLLNFIFISCFLFGQTNNVVTTILEGDGYTYVRKLSPSDMVHLYNQANQLTHVNLVYKDTGKRPPLHLREKRVEDEAWSYEKAREIVNNVSMARPAVPTSAYQFAPRNSQMTLYASPDMRATQFIAMWTL